MDPRKKTLNPRWKSEKQIVEEYHAKLDAQDAKRKAREALADPNSLEAIAKAQRRKEQRAASARDARARMKDDPRKYAAYLARGDKRKKKARENPDYAQKEREAAAVRRARNREKLIELGREPTPLSDTPRAIAARAAYAWRKEALFLLHTKAPHMVPPGTADDLTNYTLRQQLVEASWDFDDTAPFDALLASDPEHVEHEPPVSRETEVAASTETEFFQRPRVNQEAEDAAFKAMMRTAREKRNSL